MTKEVFPLTASSSTEALRKIGDIGKEFKLPVSVIILAFRRWVVVLLHFNFIVIILLEGIHEFAIDDEGIQV